MDVGEDRISILPESLILHILSFLQIKCIVSTSVLSKRWRYLWTDSFVIDCEGWKPHYDNDDDVHMRSERFMNSMDEMLSLDNKRTIKSFRVDADDMFDDSRVSAWISNLVRRKVEELYLTIHSDSFQFPLSFTTCESLSVFELRMTACIFDFPESISFPRLRILLLEDFIFADDNLTQQFISNCPVLEELILINCSWLGLTVVSISAPRLKVLYINGFKAFAKCLDNCEVKIYAPNLLSLTYIDIPAKDHVLRSLSSLVDAHIDIFTFPKTEEVGYGASKLLGGLSNVKLLKISGETFEALSMADDDLLAKLPKFYNLIKLVVRSRFSLLRFPILLDFLHISPNLESVVFAQGIEVYSNDHVTVDLKSWKLDLVPQCLMLHLKSVEFQGFDGNSSELNVAKNVFWRMQEFCRG